jgi:uncharacterized protein YcnI
VNKTLILIPLLALATAAQAHVTLDQPQAAAGSSVRAVFKVGHGCDGSPTHTLVVRVPAAVKNAKPMPKPGWTLTVDDSATEGRVITWKAASREQWLREEFYDEFVVRLQAPAQPGPQWFKVLQLCEKGQGDWSEVPASGNSTKGLKAPAALLDVTPAGEHAGHVH